MLQPQLTIYEHTDSCLADLLEAFMRLAEESIQRRGVFRVSLSGGSTPQRLYQSIARSGLDLSRIEWFWGDERNVPHDHSESNFRMVAEALLRPAGVPAENIFAVPVNVDDPAAAAREYEAALRKQFEGATVPVAATDSAAAANQDAGSDLQFPAWDLVLLGMGDDAHTASLFPGTTALDERSRWFVENWVDKFAAHRYTLTAPAINSGREIWFLITGAAKREAVGQVLGDQVDPHRYPSQLIRPTRFFITADAMPQ